MWLQTALVEWALYVFVCVCVLSVCAKVCASKYVCGNVPVNECVSLSVYVVVRRLCLWDGCAHLRVCVHICVCALMSPCVCLSVSGCVFLCVRSALCICVHVCAHVLVCACAVSECVSVCVS